MVFMSWFSARTLTLLQTVLVNGYSFENILRTFKLAGVPSECFKKYDVYPRTSKSVLVKETLSCVTKLSIKERNQLLLTLLDDILITQPHGPQYGGDEAYQIALSRLEKSIKMDGFEMKDNELVRLVEEDLIKEESILVTSLKNLELDLVIHHLEKSKDHFIDGEWDSANGQTRKTLEALTQEIAQRIADIKGELIQKRHDKPRPVEIRKYLKTSGFLDEKEFQLLTAFYQYVSEEGGHPGLSNETDARLRRLMLIGLCQFYIEKLKNYLKKV